MARPQEASHGLHLAFVTRLTSAESEDHMQQLKRLCLLKLGLQTCSSSSACACLGSSLWSWMDWLCLDVTV